MQVDLPEKTRHAVQMAATARALARAASNPHVKRLVARRAFVHLHDVERFAPAWLNVLAKRAATSLTAEAAKPALDRFRRDWCHYQDVRHYLGAKRQRHEPGDPVEDERRALELWADVGELSVDALVDDAIELFAQLAALKRLQPIDANPPVHGLVQTALDHFEPICETPSFYASASSFAATRSLTAALRQGGEIGRLVPLINDVSESAELFASVARVADSELRRFVNCALPADLYELLRLTVGPPGAARYHGDQESLRALYESQMPGCDASKVLNNLRSRISERAYEMLHDWRNRLGSHTDEATPWALLDRALSEHDPVSSAELFEDIKLDLEHAACADGGPPLLLLGTARFEAVRSTAGYEVEFGYDEGTAKQDAGSLRSALPPAHADSEFVIWIDGPQGAYLAPAIAGAVAGRSGEVARRLEARRQKRGMRPDD